jgi:hypothetical protein
MIISVRREQDCYTQLSGKRAGFRLRCFLEEFLRRRSLPFIPCREKLAVASRGLNQTFVVQFIPDRIQGFRIAHNPAQPDPAGPPRNPLAGPFLSLGAHSPASASTNAEGAATGRKRCCRATASSAQPLRERKATLVFWLTGFGAAAVVHAPAQLRAQMRGIAQGMAAASA